MVGIPLVALFLMRAAKNDDLVVLFSVFTPWICGVVVALLQPAKSCRQRGTRACWAMVMGLFGVIFAIDRLIFG